ncbi:hypothetical protein JW877_00110 [bacterium]|nr:hypothetical protein [bacterium]
MTRKQLIKWFIFGDLALIFLILMMVGIGLKEVIEIFVNGTILCLSCIGIG